MLLEILQHKPVTSLNNKKKVPRSRNRRVEPFWLIYIVFFTSLIVNNLKDITCIQIRCELHPSICMFSTLICSELYAVSKLPAVQTKRAMRIGLK